LVCKREGVHKKIARAKLDKVGFWQTLRDFRYLTNIFMLIFINPFFLLVFLQLIQSEERGKVVEVQELSSEVEKDDDADDEEEGSGDESSGGGSNSNDDEDGRDEASSNRETSSPKVDIVG
jgi:hypothetical protein